MLSLFLDYTQTVQTKTLKKNKKKTVLNKCMKMDETECVLH